MIRSEKNKIDDTSKLMYSKDAMQIYDYSTSGGKNLILEYIKDLPDALKAEILDTRQLIREKGIDAFNYIKSCGRSRYHRRGSCM